jgi:hypothetical protein
MPRTSFGDQLARQVQLLGGQRCAVKGHAGDVAGRTAEAWNQPHPDRVASDREHNRNGRGRRLCRQRRRGAADRRDQSNLSADQIGRERRQPLVIALRPAVFDRDVAALDEAHPTEALVECGHDEVEVARAQTAEESNHRDGRLLRERRERPKKRRHGRRAADERDELTPPHVEHGLVLSSGRR